MTYNEWLNISIKYNLFKVNGSIDLNKFKFLWERNNERLLRKTFINVDDINKPFIDFKYIQFTLNSINKDDFENLIKHNLAIRKKFQIKKRLIKMAEDFK